MNTELLNKLIATIDAIDIDTDPFAIAKESLSMTLDDDITYQVTDNRLKAREDKNKYDAMDMATNDIVMFFDVSKATKTELIKLLDLCANFEYCELSGDFIIALMDDDKEKAQELKPEFYDEDELANITSATLTAWLNN